MVKIATLKSTLFTLTLSIFKLFPSFFHKLTKLNFTLFLNLRGCRCCDFCHSGNPHYCNIGGIQNTVGIHRDGGWATYALVPTNLVQKLPDSITLEQGYFGKVTLRG